MSLEGCRSPSCPASKENAFFFSVGRDTMCNYWSLGPQNLTVMLGLQVTGALIRCRQTFELNSMVFIAASELNSSVQIV